jgi:hypothetical protein
MGIEPTRPAWKAGVLPLNYARKASIDLIQPTCEEWGKQDSNLRRRCHQIYSLAPLATRVFPPVCFFNFCFVDKSTGFAVEKLAVGLEPTTSGLQNRSSAN